MPSIFLNESGGGGGDKGFVGSTLVPFSSILINLRVGSFFLGNTLY
jgi:hypothetical protein